MKNKVYAFISRFYDMAISFFMLVFGVIVLAFFALNLYELFLDLFTYQQHVKFNSVTETVLSAFLCFEFAVIIKEYFDRHSQISFENYLYIAITAIIRSVLVNHTNAIKTLLLCVAILVLVAGIIVYKRFYGKHEGMHS
ncbi:phosphate-starvation-inducible PsiE family protein [Leuconostocaceae bacterium ESL0723]|nr:phosphate-starvation-inducible PsiE family protein [Lactobacillaceae bacterium L1_55_11]WEV54715.1 phosphate-starvation-inducible PsiE family protein [Leuconostocaceae bacterium ESL0723]